MDLLETVKHFQLSRKAKEAIKVGLAFSLVYVIALLFGWKNPYWAGFAVAQIALFPAGQSLHNGALRVGGVIIAVFASLLIYALAPQERWLFATLSAMWMMFTTYMMIRDQKHSYLWNVAGFAVVAILVVPAFSSYDIFANAVARGLETTMGIVVYTLVTVFIWPDTNIGALKKVTIGLTSVQAKIFSLMGSQNSTEVKKSLKETVEHEVQLLGALKQSFYAKGSETYEVQKAAEFWKEFYILSTQLGQSFNRLNNSFLGLRNIDIYQIAPRLDEYRQEINKRFELTGAILQKGAREIELEPVVLEVDEAYLKNLAPFDQIAFASSKREFEAVEELSQTILECANNIMDDSVGKKMTAPKTQLSIYERLAPDLDHLKAALFIGSLTFVCFCVWIFINPPGHMYWMMLAPTVGMMVAAIPQMRTNNMVIPAVFILPFFLMVNQLIMPQLSGMTQLAPLLFICIFCVFYFLTGTLKVVAVIGVVSKLLITNEQAYDFAGSANMIIWSVSSYAFIYAFSYILSSPRPQRAVLNLIRRYFKSADFLVSEMQNNAKRGIFRNFKIAFHRYELRTLPLKIKSWSKAIKHKDYPENSPDKIDDLLLNIATLSYSIEEWFLSSRLHQSKLILPETIEELAKWSRGIGSVFKGYYSDLDSSISRQMEEDLKIHMTTLEAIVNQNLEYIKQLRVTSQEKENFYRLMGSYYGLTNSLISYAGVAEQINWKHWEEEVFA